MVKSQVLSVNVEAAPEYPLAKKVAEMDVYGIRWPFSADSEIMTTIVNVIDTASVQKGQPTLKAQNPRLHEETWAFWKCTVDIVDTSIPSGKTTGIQYFIPALLLTPAFWLALIILILGMMLGYLIGKWWTYRTVVRPLEEALQEVVRDVDEIIAMKEEALAAGQIDADFAAELDTKLEGAKKKADEAGANPSYDWVDYLGKALEYIPWIIGGVVVYAALNTIAAFAPRRRD
jgi:hypothetical protein